MSHTSEDRVPVEAQEGATILPFERPQSELQKAVQMRAQEQIERIRRREHAKRNPNPWRVAIVVVLAAIPVIALFSGVDAFLRAIQMYMATQAAEPAQTESQPEPPQEIESSSEPGVVFLQPNLASGSDAPVAQEKQAEQQNAPQQPQKK